MSTFSITPTIIKKVRFEEYVKIKFIPALEGTKPLPKKYFNTTKKNNNQQIPLLKPKVHQYQPGIKKFMTMVFR